MGLCLPIKKIVRIVLAGGKEEIYRFAVPASIMTEKYPGMCVARPEVFISPHKSFLEPEETLLPGHKYYVIPLTTAQKLKRKHSKNIEVKGPTENKEDISAVLITWDTASGNSEDFICSAKEFYTSRERWSNCLRKNVRVGKPFVPPLPSARMPKGFGWMPRLSSVQELSP